MRQKVTDRRRSKSSGRMEATPTDAGDTARQIALFETGNGWQHGLIEIFIALTGALLLMPLRPFLRSRPRDRP